jgi:predicted HicB family RNase H-like nuclease
MQKNRLQVDISQDLHKKLKVYCAELGITLKNFIINMINEKMDTSSDKKNEETK